MQEGQFRTRDKSAAGPGQPLDLWSTLPTAEGYTHSADPASIPSSFVLMAEEKLLLFKPTVDKRPLAVFWHSSPSTILKGLAL